MTILNFEKKDTAKEIVNQKFFNENQKARDLKSQCLSHMAANEIPFIELLIADGAIHRFSIDQKKNQRDEWYIAFEGLSGKGNPYLCCLYGSWSANSKFEFKSWTDTNNWDEQERHEIQDAIKKKRQEIDQQLENEKIGRVKRAQKHWEEAQEDPSHEDHTEYLKVKNVRPYGVKFGLDSQCRKVLIIPIRNIEGEIQSVQFISKEGEKRIHGLKRGNFHLIGLVTETSKIIVAEGYATGATIHEMTGDPVAIAFDCGNIDPVISNLKIKYPKNQIVIAADDDRETKNNPGRIKAEEAVKKYNCRMILPKFPENARLPNGKCPTDFNDLFFISGKEEVKKQIDYAQYVSIHQEKSLKKEWGTPKPIKGELCSVPPFDPETLLPEVLHDWVMDEANRMPCPPDFIAAAVVVTLGSVIGARCAIKPKLFDSWAIVPNLWGGIVGLPSAKKSPAISIAMKPLDRLIAKAAASQKEAAQAFESEKTIFEARNEAIVTRIKSAAKDSTKGDIDLFAKELQEHRQNAPESPILRRYKSNDTTIEKLGEMLKDNPNGLLVLRDELTGMLSSWDKRRPIFLS